MDFNNKAKTYNKYANIQTDLIDWSQEWLEDDLSGISALELGAGTGLFTKHIIDRGAKVTATDLSSEMVNCGEKIYPSAKWLELDAWSPKINPKFNPFTRLYSSSLLQWVPYPISTLKLWKECLPNGGRMLSSFFIHNTLRELEQLNPNLYMFDWHEADSWNNFFRDAGWNIIRSESVEKVYTFPDSLDLFRTLHGIGATNPNQLKPMELKKLIRRYNERFMCEGGVESTWSFFKIECST